MRMRLVGLGYAALVCAALGCAADLDTTREPVDTNGFGMTVVTLACKRMAYLADRGDGDGRIDVRGDAYRDVCRGLAPPPADAPDSLRALVAERESLVRALDAALPEAMVPDVQAFLTSDEFLALHDDDTTLAAVNALIELLRFAADDPAIAPALHQALERLGHRNGYVPLSAALGAVHGVVRYPELHQLLLAITQEITEGGGAYDAWQGFLGAASVTLRHAAPVAAPADPERTGALALALLMTESPLLATGGSTGEPIELVRRDHRGVALVRRDDEDRLPAPFSDSDGDGLADVDELGRFVGASGALAAVPSPYAQAPGEEALRWRFRDGAGRALADTGGPLLYEHTKLDETLLAALARDGISLFDPAQGVALNAVRGASALMGARQQRSRIYDSGERFVYTGYDTARAPLLDMFHAYLQVLRDPAIQDVLELAVKALTEQEAALARLVEAAIETARAGGAYPDLGLASGSPLWDDLIPVFRSMAARPGLMPDLLRALEQPEVSRLGLRLRDYMKYADRFSYDANQAVTGSFSTPVDRSQPDNGFNRSVWQRLIHLIADSSGAVFCNKQGARIELGGIPLLEYDECELLRIEDLAVFFVQSMVYAKDANGDVIYDDGVPRRKATLPWASSLIDAVPDSILDGLLQDQTGILGLRTHPTPEALSRMLFLQPTPEFLANITDPPVCRDGHVFSVEHADTLAAWEPNGFYEQIRPILQVFADHEAEALFVELIVVLHRHWPSRQSTHHQQSDPAARNYAWASDVASYEPLLVDILARNTLVPALVDTAPALNALRVGERSYGQILEAALRFILEPRPDLAKRDGSTQSRTSDGRVVAVLSPWQILADAYENKRLAIADSGAVGQAWEHAVGKLVDVLVRAEEVPTQGWRFRNPRLRGMAVTLVRFLQARIAVHDAAGDRAQWLARELPERLEEVLAGPLFAAAVDLVLAVDASPEARRQLESLMAYLFDEGGDETTFRNALTATADLLQLGALDDRDMLPIARFLGELLRPDRGWVSRPLAFLDAARSTDQTQALARLARNLYSDHRTGRTPIGDLIDGLGEVHRARPFRDLNAPFLREDYRAVLRGVADFLEDEQRGLRKFIAIVKGREL